ncbi:beta-1,6-N-acetylglucosaminyltransferase [Fructobacillus sp. EFB-N1]|uniref:beta-1,6-N-acetylglucosaminyltransferase n=1 Tax=Fructobacillus TaxID=559173 RepID=UPI00064DD29C
MVQTSQVSVIATQSVTWAASSVMRAELNLMNHAFNSGHYRYFHLLSGQDLAVKSATTIYIFLTIKMPLIE